MSCYYPNKIFWINGPGVKGMFTSGRIDHLEYKNNSWIPIDVPYVSPYAEVVFRDMSKVPCGQCIGCRLDRAKAWQVRLMLEAKRHTGNYFLTLTYDDKNIPITYYANPENGSAIKGFTLRKRDLQDFVKRLRRYCDYHKCDLDDFKYYACGEYGDITQRPHYHMIALGLNLDDFKYFSNVDGHNYYTSETLSKLWSKGHVLIGQAELDSIGYVARYCTKKLNGDLGYKAYMMFNRVPPFALMSKGIAAEWYTDNYDKLWMQDSIVVPTADGHFKTKPSRYFLEKLKKDDVELYETIKDNRKNICLTLDDYYNDNCVYEEWERLEMLARNKNKQIQKLKRRLTE